MFGKKESDYRKVCLLCENATVLPQGNEVLCKFKGVVSEDHTCRKFTYDPLKRCPAPKPEMPTISKEDLF